VLSNTFKVSSLLTGYQIFAEILLDVYEVPSGPVEPKQLAPTDSMMYDENNLVIFEFKNVPYIPVLNF
jgi:hypothetical protein